MTTSWPFSGARTPLFPSLQWSEQLSSSSVVRTFNSHAKGNDYQLAVLWCPHPPLPVPAVVGAVVVVVPISAVPTVPAVLLPSDPLYPQTVGRIRTLSGMFILATICRP